MPEKLTIGLSLSLSGAYATMGRQAESAIRLFASDLNASGRVSIGGRRLELGLEIIDDESRPDRCAEIYRHLSSDQRVDLLFGPYSSRLARVAAPIAEGEGRLMVNHGGADDDLYEQGHRLLVGVLSSAGDYFADLAGLISTLKFWRKRVAVVASPTPFARAVALGFERACMERAARRHGVRVRHKHDEGFDGARPVSSILPELARARINVVVSSGSFEHDVALMRAIAEHRLNVPVMACVAAGVHAFGAALGPHAEGIVGPSQWEQGVQTTPELGPTAPEFVRRMRAAGGVSCDYPAAQIYAAGLLTVAALRDAGSLDPQSVRAAFSDLRTSTFYGDFAINRVTGRQLAHKVLLVQWHEGAKAIIHPNAHADAGALEFPSGWRLILASLRELRLRRGHGDNETDAHESDPR